MKTKKPDPAPPKKKQQEKPDAPPPAPTPPWRSRITGQGEVDPGTLLANPKNWRLHPKQQKEGLTAILDGVGWVQRIVVNKKSGFVVDGHLRVQLAIAKGEKKVPVVYVELTDREENIILAAFDPLAALAGTDKEALAKVLKEAIGSGPEIDTLLAKVSAGAGLGPIGGGTDAALQQPAMFTDLDVVAKKWKVQPGELFELGAHRILCGDSADPKAVGRLMNGQTAGLFCTDPPYGVDYGDIKHSRDRAAAKKAGQTPTARVAGIDNDGDDGPKLQAWLERIFTTWGTHLKINAAWYLWHAQKTQGFFTAAAAASMDVLYHRQIVWVKPRMILGRGDFHRRHELCFYGWRTGHRPAFHAKRNKTTVWELATVGNEGRLHPMQKPVECFAWPMEYSTKKGEICAEPFSGGGSQILAGEQTGRRVFAMEIEPKYVAASIEQWHLLTGRKPKRSRG